MNIILTMTSLLNMTESGCADQSKNGSFQTQEEQASTSGLPRHRRKQLPPIWELLMKKKAPRGNPKVGVAIKRLQHAQAIKSQNSNCVLGSKSDCAIWCKVQRCSYVPNDQHNLLQNSEEIG